MSESIVHLSHYIAGEWLAANGQEWTADINPSNATEVLARIPSGDATVVNHAVEAAQAGFERWRTASGPQRAEILHQAANLLARRRQDLATLVALEVGKPIGEALQEVDRGVVILRYFAEEAVHPVGMVIPAQQAASLQFTLRQPLGPVAVISPWNFPVAIPLWKIAPALAYGNTIVWKPAETASLMAARNIKYQLEMGGKNAALVLADADLDQAARLVASGAMRYAGQKCTATSRAIVASEVSEAFLDRLKAEIRALPLAPAIDPGSAVGPLITSGALEKVGRYAEMGFKMGQVLMGGHHSHEEKLKQGFFFEPTVVADVPNDAPLVQEEIFGPLLVVQRARSIDEVLSLANSTKFGLSVSLFTRDLNAALHYIQDIQCGMVRVNGDTTGVDPHAPFGGMRASSSHSREQGPAAIEFFTETKTVQMNSAGGR